MTDNTLKDALDAFRECEAHEKKNRIEALDDLKFARLGEQWPDKMRKQREAENRPCLTINRMPAFIRQVVNDARQNRPSIKVHPVEQGDAETAEVINGLIRNIEVTSNADVAYDAAIDSAVTMGWGYWRINLDYACDDSFEKDLVIRAVTNPFSIYGDPYSQAADSSDWNVSFVIDQMSEARFRRRFKNAKKIEFAASGVAEGWLNKDTKTVRVAEYWTRDEVVKQLYAYQHASGSGNEYAFEDELAKKKAELEGFEVIGQPRPVKSYKVTQHTLNGVEVLETVNWLGRYIPIVPVYGDEVNVEGERYFRSLVRDAKDPARMFNYWRTTGTELVALAPKAPYIGRKGAFASDPNWDTANEISHSKLEYDGPEMPQRQPFSGVPAGVLQEALNASDDMKAVMGIYDASLGARSNETSGRAIMARQREGDVSTFHFIDNQTRAIRHTGKILIDLIPKVYNTERVIRTLGEDRKEIKTAQITDGQANPAAGIYNLTAGKYDLTVKAGPSFTTQREESAAMLTELVRANPESAAILGDVIVENMDIPGGDKVVKRLQAMLPPQVRAADEGESAEAVQVQAITQQAQQAVGALQAELAALQQDKSLEREKIEVDRYKAETDRMQALAPAFDPQQIVALTVQTVAEMLGANAPQETPAQPAASMPPEGMEMMGQMEPVGIVPPGQPEGLQL